MHIAVVLEYFYDTTRPVGGAERQLGKLVGELVRQGQSVTVLTGAWSPQMKRVDLTQDVRIHRLFAGFGLLNIRGLRKFAHYLYLLSLFAHLFLNRKQYDVIHCHSSMTSAFIVSLVGKWFNKPTLARPMASGSEWGDIARMKNQRSLMGSRWMIDRLYAIDRIVALNDDVTHELCTIGIPRSKITHIPNGVEIDPTRFKENYKLSCPVTISFIGRLHPQKGIDTLLDAVWRIVTSTQALRWTVQLVGDGPLLLELEQRVRELDLQSSVRFMGQVSDVFDVLRGTDVFVLPSRAEGMSNALLEAMSFGLPCIVSNIPANSALVTHESTGLLFDCDDASMLAEQIVRAVQDAQLRQRIGESARNVIIENYSIESVARKYTCLYRALIADRLAA